MTHPQQEEQQQGSEPVPSTPARPAGEGEAKISPISGEPQRPASAVVERVADAIGYDLKSARFKRGQNYGTLCETLAAQVATLTEERDRLAKVVEKLPVTADGVPIVQGDSVWFMDEKTPDTGKVKYVRQAKRGDKHGPRVVFLKPYPHAVFGETTSVPLGECYSTREAAALAASPAKAEGE